MSEFPNLTPSRAASFADIALANVVREFPNKPDHVMGTADDARRPRELHPVFYGSFDWHSCVHMHWLLARVRRLVPELPQRAAIDALFDAHLTPPNVATECAYLARPESRGFERTYGWAWLLELATELRRGDDAGSQRWSATLRPLADAFVGRYVDYLPRQHHPLRAGVHPNSAFGLLFALDYARVAGESALERLCVERAHAWYAGDSDAPAAWEPSGTDFLSPVLIEAELMRRVLPPAEFATLARRFPARIGPARAAHAVHAGGGRRPQRSFHRSSRWPEFLARVVPARYRVGATSFRFARRDPARCCRCPPRGRNERIGGR